MTDQRRTIIGAMLIFGLQPCALGAWLALIPHVKETLGLNKGELALCLLGMPLALVPTLQIASRVVSRIGPRRVMMFAFPMQAWTFILPLLARTPTELFFALAVNGAVMAFTESGLNVYAGRLEKIEKVVIMSRCHGAWALGMMVGSALVTLAIPFEPIPALLTVSITTSLYGAWVSYSLPRLRGDDPGGTIPPRRSLAQLPPALLLISLFVFAVTLTEGAMADWAAVYLSERLPETATHEGIAVSIFAAFLAAGRFVGDAVNVRFGPVVLARTTIGFAILGLALLIIPLPLWTSYPGFALVGLGVSAGFPLGISAVAALDDTYEAPNIAIAAMISISGFLVGPPLIGFLSEAFSLRIGFLAMVPMLLLALFLARWLGTKADSPAKSLDSTQKTP